VRPDVVPRGIFPDYDLPDHTSAPRKVSQLPIRGQSSGPFQVLIIAGVIEAFVSPTGLAIALKFAMSGTLLVLLCAYLFGAGQGAEAVSSRVKGRSQ
jgi:hypothetical protein